MSEPLIVETSDNRLFEVRDAGDDYPHAWIGHEVKKTKAGYVPKARSREILVRRAGCKFINGSFDTVEDFGRALLSTAG